MTKEEASKVCESILKAYTMARSCIIHHGNASDLKSDWFNQISDDVEKAIEALENGSVN